MLLKYPILQSGFLGLTETGLTKQLPKQPSFAETILFTEVNHEYDNLFYSQDVSELFTQWQAQFKLINDFSGFRVKVLEQAMQRFGPSMLDWMSFQANKPGFSNTHRQFLTKMSVWMNESTDAPADSAEVVRWVGILGPGQGNNVDFDIGALSSVDQLGSTTAAIGNWVAKEGGYESLLGFMYVIFGKRVGHTQKPSVF